MGLAKWSRGLLGAWLLLSMGLSAAETETAVSALLDRTKRHRLLLIGEIHGTAEVPALVGDLAAAIAAEYKLVIGLEIPRDEQARINVFLGSAGNRADRAAMLQGAFWSRTYQDGRSSLAMADLLERLRLLQRQFGIQVLALDQVNGGDAIGDVRDELMAERLAEALQANADARALVLTGNFHTRVQKGAPWDESHQFLGYRLRSFEPYAIEIMGVAGSAWICTNAEAASCKARDFPENTLQPEIDFGDEVNPRGHHGVWRIESTSASPPAVAAS